MASTTVTTRSLPKRKRAAINYHESSTDESDLDDEYATSEEESAARARKNLKTSPAKSVPTKPLSKRNIFPFNSLPAELKNEIYTLALTDEHKVFLTSKTKRYRRTVQRYWLYENAPSSSLVRDPDQSNLLPPYHDPPTFVPNLLVLNKAIHAEAQPVLYASNAFAVEDTMAMHSFLAIIGPRNRATITDLTIKGWGHRGAHKAFNHPAFTMLASAVNLKYLRLDCRIGYGSTKSLVESTARQLFRSGFHWFEAVGSAQCRFDAAIDLIEIEDEHLTPSPYIQKPGLDWSKEDKMAALRKELRKLLAW